MKTAHLRVCEMAHFIQKYVIRYEIVPLILPYKLYFAKLTFIIIKKVSKVLTS